nr:matrix protein [Pinctada fucata]
MQKLILAVLLLSLLAIATARPKYHTQGRRRIDACCLNCLYDAIMCESPCRLLFRSRFSYLTCARDCRRDRVDCYIGCKKIDAAPVAKTEEGAEAGSLGKGEAVKGGKGGKGGSATVESGSDKDKASNKTHDDDDDDHDDVEETED